MKLNNKTGEKKIKWQCCGFDGNLPRIQDLESGLGSVCVKL